jgi:hypothetical protein
MMFGGANASAMRRSQNHRARKPPLSSVAESGRVIHQLINAGIKESHELDLANRFEPLRRHAHAESPDQSFRQRRVENTLGPETLLQASGCAEHAAIDTDIFAEDDNIRIIRQRPSERQIDRVD